MRAEAPAPFGPALSRLFFLHFCLPLAAPVEGRFLGQHAAGRVVHVPLADLKSVGNAAPDPISAADATSVLIVVDLANANPGRSGVLRVKSSALSN